MLRTALERKGATSANNPHYAPPSSAASGTTATTLDMNLDRENDRMDIDDDEEGGLYL